MFSMSIHLDSSCTMLDNSVCEFLTRYIVNTTPLLHLFYRSSVIFLYVYWLHTILLCCVSGVFKVISNFTSLLNPWVVLLIIYGWEILRVILVRSHLIVHPMSSYSSNTERVLYSLLVHSIVSINDGFYLIDNVSSTYTMIIAVPGSFTLYKIQGTVLHCFNPSSWVNFLDVFLKQTTCCLYETVDIFYQCQYVFVLIIIFKYFCHSLWYLRVDLFF